MKIFILSFLYLFYCMTETLILKKEKVEYKKIWLIFLLGLPLFLYFQIPYIAMICFPFLIGQCVIDFTKLELSDINNGILFGISILFGFYNGFHFVSLAIIGIAFFILYLLPFSNMGFGDVKLLFATALFVSPKLIPSYIFYMLIISLVIGILYKIVKKKNEFPMGPAIATMCFLIQII